MTESELPQTSPVVRPPFEAFPKIPRLKRNIIITEKLDGTNAQIRILSDGTVLAGSRNRYITPTDDNYGFAAWVAKYEAGLRELLGPGTHYGEWWGAGIQRRYGLSEKRFWLFNVDRWKHFAWPHLAEGQEFKEQWPHIQDKAQGIGVVPTLYRGDFQELAVNVALNKLQNAGSVAVPGFMQPEGVVVFMSASATMHKVLLENDEYPKGLAPELPKGKIPFAEKQLNAGGEGMAGKLTIMDMVHDAYESGKAKGFHDIPATFGDRIALCHSELSEALEAFRDNDNDAFNAMEPLYRSAQSGKLTRSPGEYVREPGLSWKPNKPEGIPSELADVVIRIADMCGLYGIDLEKAIQEKMAYNKTRPYRHGGKKL